jgi:hypothetical protein
MYKNEKKVETVEASKVEPIKLEHNAIALIKVDNEYRVVLVPFDPSSNSVEVISRTAARDEGIEKFKMVAQTLQIRNLGKKE